ncbi:MAG: hypothetical protein Q4B82_01025 [Alysiella sp.]|uniref:hypothetical protein n=1 Tax=Alysiella sp. TaxID=1872483 RepID=UPI0026DB1669|nr:hypothetical protein [Alysiella sp.]MDO4433150.1 hypothetical protein [Alysiella sp.]
MDNKINPSLEQLESRVRGLVDKINKLRADNHRLRDELALSKQDLFKQSQELEKALNRPAPTVHQSELEKTLAHQQQEIQLLEKERLNLRDQIAFLHNTIQNKDKDWREKNEAVRTEWESKVVDAEQQMAAAQERISSLELKLQVLQTDVEQTTSLFNDAKKRAEDAENQLTAQLASTMELETKLANALQDLSQQKTETEQKIAEQQSHLTEQQSQFEAKLAQETERFRIEYAMLGKQHEQSLNDLTQAMNVQKERLREETAVVQQQVVKLQAQNRAYRALLEQNAENIRVLLARLPVPEHEKEKGEA